MTTAHKRIPLYSQIRSYVIDRIRQGEWGHNDRLPSENELATQFDVSRITVKNALSKLVEEGIIYKIQGKGTFVASQTGGEPVKYRAEPAKPVQELVAFLMPRLDNRFMANLLKGIEGELSEHKYRLVFSRTHDSLEQERELMQEAVERGVKGIVVYPVEGETYSEDILRLTLKPFPIVVIDRYLRGVETNCVCSDHFGGACQAASHLLGLGHTKIAFVSSPCAGTTSLEDRLEGYKQALSDYNLPVEHRLLLMLVEPDREAIGRFLQQNPDVTAVFAANVGIGMMVMEAAEQLGKQVPSQLSVIFFDDFAYSEHSRIPPTCIVQQEEAIGRKAAELLISVIREPSGERRKIVLPTTLKLGGSTASCSNRRNANEGG